MRAHTRRREKKRLMILNSAVAIAMVVPCRAPLRPMCVASNSKTDQLRAQLDQLHSEAERTRVKGTHPYTSLLFHISDENNLYPLSFWMWRHSLLLYFFVDLFFNNWVIPWNWFGQSTSNIVLVIWFCPFLWIISPIMIIAYSFSSHNLASLTQIMKNSLQFFLRCSDSA